MTTEIEQAEGLRVALLHVPILLKHVEDGKYGRQIVSYTELNAAERALLLRALDEYISLLTTIESTPDVL